MTAQVGRVLGERYRLVSPLGSGTSNEVYLADDVRLHRRVAVKILHPALVEDVRFLQRFRAEARAAAALNHPNIVAVFDWNGEAQPYLVTEYMSGGSLSSMLEAGQRLSPSQALVVGLEAAQALEFAHRQGLVHRDIKPANLLFGGDARLRIADFGLARALAEAAVSDPTGGVPGTARYASPEQARGEPLDGRSDIYSLGLVLIEAVTGSVPFASDTTIGTLMARVDRPVAVPEALSALVPVLSRVCGVSPAERPDATTLIEELKQAATQLPRPAQLPVAAPGQMPPGQLQDVAAPIDHPASGEVPGPDAGSFPDERVVTAPLPAVDVTNTLDVPPPEVEDHDDMTRPMRAAAPDSGSRPRSAGTLRLPRWLAVTIAVVAALAVGVSGTWFFQQASVPSHVVPEALIGAQASEINQLIGEYGWRIDQRDEFRDGTFPGQILETDPRPGTALREGEPLVVVVSLGPPLVSVPQDLAGVPREEAEMRLAGEGFDVEIVPVESREVPEGMVIGLGDGTEPELPKGSMVTLVVSAGPPRVTVPSLEGRRYEEAREELRALGLDMERERERDRTVRRDRVIRTEPAAGTELQPGDTVTVVVSRSGRVRDRDDDDD
jgi:eukaryotic-like serine/threonine-protein kinase